MGTSEGDGAETRIDAADIEALDLALHRAMRSRDRAGTFSVHLPAIEVHDHTEGCEVDGGIWSGEAYQARLVQEWVLSVNERLVLSGQAVWRRPRDVTP